MSMEQLLRQYRADNSRAPRHGALGQCALPAFRQGGLSQAAVAVPTVDKALSYRHQTGVMLVKLRRWWWEWTDGFPFGLAPLVILAALVVSGGYLLSQPIPKNTVTLRLWTFTNIHSDACKLVQ